MAQTDIAQYCAAWRELNSIYDKFAKEHGVTYTDLQVLEVIYDSQGHCTQKSIAEATFLPKQTVNSIVTNFWKQGIVELRELPTDRRNKTIHFTAKGDAYADSLVVRLKNAEKEAFDQLAPASRDALVQDTEQFKNTLRTCLGQGNQ